MNSNCLKIERLCVIVIWIECFISISIQTVKSLDAVSVQSVFIFCGQLQSLKIKFLRSTNQQLQFFGVIFLKKLRIANRSKSPPKMDRVTTFPPLQSIQKLTTFSNLKNASNCSLIDASSLNSIEI